MAIACNESEFKDPQASKLENNQGNGDGYGEGYNSDFGENGQNNRFGDGTDDGNNPDLNDASFEIIAGAEVNTLGVGFDGGDHDDWNDGAYCIEASDAYIVSDNETKKIQVINDTSLTIKLAGFSYPGPTVTIYSVDKNGDKSTLVSESFNYKRNCGDQCRHTEVVDVKAGTMIDASLRTGGGAEKFQANHARFTNGSCPDYNSSE